MFDKSGRQEERVDELNQGLSIGLTNALGYDLDALASVLPTSF